MSHPSNRTSPRRRIFAFLAVLSLLLLSGCGSDDKGGKDKATADTGLAPISVTGDFGAAPKVSFSEALTVSETTEEVLHEGSGDALAEGDSALVHIVLANGTSEKVLYDSYQIKQPQLIPVDETLAKGLRTALLDRPVGSRVMVAAPPKDAYGEQGNPQLGIGNGDTVVYIVDIMSKVPEKITGEEKPLPAGMPTLVKDDQGVITGWDFTGSTKPDGKLGVYPLIEGDGAKVTPASTVVVRYLGQVYGGKKPFDGNYSAPQPIAFPLSNLVKGWQEGLNGVAAGSRVVVVVPPELGYGEAGNPQAGIKGTDTLYFVLDVLAAG